MRWVREKAKLVRWVREKAKLVRWVREKAVQLFSKYCLCHLINLR